MSGIQFLFINDVISEISCRETKTKMVRHQNHNRLNKCHFELRRKFHYSLSKSTKSPHLLPPHTPTPASRPSSKNGYRTTCSCSSNVCNLRLDLNYSFSFLTSFFLSFSFFLSQKKKKLHMYIWQKIRNSEAEKLTMHGEFSTAIMSKT